MAVFNTEIQVRFNHVDAAGIVFYPRYYEMLNQVIEEWCEQSLGFGFKDLHGEYSGGFPVAKNEVTFLNPSRLGDKLNFELAVSKLGKSSISLKIAASEHQQQRITANMILVFVKQTGPGEFYASRLPDAIRTQIENFQKQT